MKLEIQASQSERGVKRVLLLRIEFVREILDLNADLNCRYYFVTAGSYVVDNCCVPEPEVRKC